MMWSGAYGSTRDSGARGPGFDSHPDPDGIYGKLSSTFFQTTDIKMNLFICNILLVFNLTLSIVYFLPS